MTAVDVALSHRGAQTGQKLLGNIATWRHHLNGDLGHRMKLPCRAGHQDGQWLATAFDEEQTALDTRHDAVVVEFDVGVLDRPFGRSPAAHQAGLSRGCQLG